MPISAPGPRPKESLFYAPVVYLLGRLTNFRPYVGVNHKLIRDDVLRLAGIDPEDSPWPLQSISSQNRNGLYRVVHFGFYHQTRQYREESDALCCKPLDPESKGKRGWWALTDLGVKRAKALRAIYEGKIRLSCGPNTTAQFLGENFSRFYDRVTLHLRHRMPRSELFDKVEDHAMSWIERVIQRDGLRSRVVNRKPISASQVCVWARRGAYTDIRNEAREPVCRVFHGAQTAKEIREHAEVNWTEEVIPRTINESDILCHNQYAAHSEEDYISDPIESLQDTHTISQVEDMVIGEEALGQVLDQVSEILAEEISDELDPAFHQQLVHDRFVKEMTIHEIAEAHGLNFNKNESRIKLALSRIREVMLSARDEGRLDEFLAR